MAQNVLRSSTRACTTTRNIACLVRSAHYSNRATSWFRRFLSPSEEKELYLGITSSFREKLVEQSNKSAQTYSHIIEHALLSAKPTTSKVTKTGMLSIARMEQLKLDLDAAGKQKDVIRLQQLEVEMDHTNLMTVSMYNRLIRAYLWSNQLDLAEQVLDGLEKRGLVPTIRTFTYLIQAHLNNNQLSQAKSLVEQMQHLSLLRLRNSFDCSIMLKYYKTSGDSHAMEFLWRDMMLHIDTIKPSIGSFTIYLEHLLEKDQSATASIISQLTRDYLLHQQQQQNLSLHHYITWMKAVELLASKTKKQDTQTAEHLLLYLIKRAPTKMSWDKAKGAIGHIVGSYLNEGQELKALAFYYRLQKIGVPDQAFEPKIMHSIESVLKKVEKQGDDKAIIAELEGLVISHH